MYLLDENNSIVDAEFCFDKIDNQHCIVVESSGGGNPTRGVRRRNPDYNKLLSILFFRLAQAKIRLTRIVLDSARVADIPVQDRIAALDIQYPVDLTGVDVEDFRKMLGRKIAAMCRDPGATQGGNGQKRIRICLERPVKPEQLVSSSGEQSLPDKVVEYAPGLDETQREYLRTARIGQGDFRKALIKQFGGVCPVTGISNPDLLIASHIKPWSVCSSGERLDSYNGILLSALMDRLFDRGLITFGDDGQVLISPRLSKTDRELCNLGAVKPIKIKERSRTYLAYHREFEFVST